jgi:hypothetical protein
MPPCVQHLPLGHFHNLPLRQATFFATSSCGHATLRKSPLTDFARTTPALVASCTIAASKKNFRAGLISD